MKSEEEIVEMAEEMISMPEITLDIMGILNDRGTSIKDVADRVKLDEALAAFILKNCNSPLYGIRTEIHSINQALSLLGFSTIKGILMTYINKNLYKISGKSEIKNRFWVHSVTAAAFAQTIANFLKVEPEEAYLTGLLHDMGKLIIYAAENRLYETVLNVVDNKNESFMIAEEKILGFNHSEIGAMIMRKWRFANNIIEVAEFHHSNFHYEMNNEYIAIIAFANLLAHKESGNQNVNLDYFTVKYNILLEKMDIITSKSIELRNKYLEFY